MQHLQAQMFLPGDTGGLELADSSCSERHKLKLGDMEDLWGHLPSDLLTDRILKFLPLISNVRFRSVCREWYKQLSSSSPPPARGICLFGDSVDDSDRSAKSVHKSLLYQGNRKDESVSPSSLKMIKLDLTFLPKGEALQPCAAGGGLICFRRNRARETHPTEEPAFRPDAFFICNPISGKYKQLSGHGKQLVRDEVDDEFVQVIYELTVNDSNEYKFFVGRVGNSLVKLHVYDSRTGSWTTETTPEPTDPQSYTHWDLETVPVFQSGQLKIIQVQHLECEIDKKEMQSKRIYTAFPVSYGSSYRIMGTRNSLFAVEVYSTARLDVWRRDGNGWEKVSTLPPESVKILLNCSEKEPFTEDQHLHCQMCRFSEECLCIDVSKGQTHCMLTFHLQTKTWHRVHAHFKRVPNLRPSHSTMFSFSPSLEQIP